MSELVAEYVVAAQLSTADIAELLRYEAVIKRGLESFLDVGRALMAIRDAKLYRGTHGTFEEYVRERWGISRSYAHRTITAAQVVENLLPVGNILPASERQARPLAKLEPNQQREAYAAAVASAPDGKPTTAHVEKAAAKFAEPKPVAPPREVKRVRAETRKPEPTPTRAVYVEPEHTITSIRMESRRLEMQGFGLEKVNDRYRYVWQRQDEDKTEYSTTFEFAADAYDAAFARLKECGLDDRFPTTSIPVGFHPGGDFDELNAAGYRLISVGRGMWAIVHEASGFESAWAFDPADCIPQAARHHADEQAAIAAVAAEQAEEDAERAERDAQRAAAERVTFPLSPTPDERLEDARALINLLVAARDTARRHYGELTGRNTDMLEFERGTERMLERLQSLVDVLTKGATE